MFILDPGTRVRLGVLVSCLLGWPLCTLGEAQGQQPGPSEKNAEINKLLKERYDELQKAVDLLTIQYRDGRVKFEALAQAQRDAFKANVDIYDSSEERIAALRKFLEAVTQMYDMTNAMFKAGQGTGIAVHQARAIVLEVRAELLRTELKLHVATELQALRGERLDLLDKAVAQLAAQYEAGRVDLAKLTQIGRDALKAAADSNDAREKRIAKIQECERMAKKTLKIAEEKFKRGVVAGVDVLEARAFLLEVRIELLRAEPGALQDQPK